MYGVEMDDGEKRVKGVDTCGVVWRRREEGLMLRSGRCSYLDHS
jgi:hypothetical protein